MNRRHTFLGFALTLGLLCSLGLWWQTQFTTAQAAPGSVNANLTPKAIALGLGAPPTFATFTVTKTADTNNGVCDADCSLREAITAANASPGADTIVFALGAGTPSIALAAALPTITDAVTISGNTGGATRVELNGAGAGGSANGLWITAGNSTIEGLVINRFGQSGILLQTNGGNIVRNCYVGTNASGTAVLANTYGVQIDSAPNNTIGGTTADERNIISGNGSVGVFILGAAATGNKVSGNYIGTDVNGTAALGNRFGVQIRSSNTTLGGTTVGERNVISGNTNVGIYLVSAPTPASGIKVSGNYIGVDVTGTTALGNAVGGIRIEATSNNTIGGASATERNIIAGNSGIGVLILGAATGNDLRGNAIFNNSGLGIDLGNNGVTANDALDADTGPNNLQNFPVLDSLITPGTVTGTLDSAIGNSAYPVRLEFFANTALDASGNGQGEVFLGATTFSAPGAFTFNYAPVPGKPVITSTATDSNGNTSEFSTSACSTLSVLTVNNLGDLPDANTDDGVCADSAGNCTLRAALMQANAIPACVPATINFSVTGVINLTSALPNIAVNLTINGPGANLLTVRRDTGGDYRIFSLFVAKDLTVHGMTISNGKSGGIALQGTAAGGSLTLTDCVISGNEGGFGGGIFADGKVTISGCTISGNTASRQGGGINYQGFFSPNQTMRIINSTISGNTVTAGAGGSGAGILNAAFSGNNRLEVINSTIVNNIDLGTAPTGGIITGAQQIGSPPTATTILRNSIIANNTASNVAIDNSGGSPGIVTSLGNNLTSDNGGGFLTGPGDLINTNPLLAPLGNYGGPTLTHALLPGSPAINAGNNCVLTNACANNNLGFNLTNDQRGVLRPQNTTVDIGAVEAQAFTLAITGGNNQSAPANAPFPTALQVNLKEGAFDLPGAVITFTAPGSGPSLNPVSSAATTDANGNASRAVTANAIVGGPYAALATTGSLSQSFSLTNLCPITTFTPSPLLPTGQAGLAYSQTLTVTPAGSYTFSLVQGNLPSGLTLNPVTGVISGLPVVTGTYNFLIRAQVAGGCSGTQAYSLTIICPTVTVFPASLPNGTTGTPYSQALSAAPAGGNYIFGLMGALPPGLNLNSSTGVLSGTPTAKGTFNFSVTATGFGSCASAPKSYSITIGAGGCAVTLPTSLPGGAVGQLFMQTVAASPADNYTYTQTGTLPPGVSFYDAAALLFGYPAAGGSYTFTITATLGNCSATQNYTVVIGTSALRSNATATNDFDGDGKSDMAVWRGMTSEWLIRRSSDDQLQTVKWGASYNPYRDVTVAADYDGDGKTDIAVFRRGNGHWYIRQSSGGKTLDIPWGMGSDVPVPADYDGDGKADIAVWRGSEGNWYIRRSSDDQVEIIHWGSSATPYNDVAVPGDYDGDGKTDIAVFRQSNGHWYIKRSSDGIVVDKYWGLGTDVPVPADYDGDGKTDIAVWRGSDTNWYIVRSSDSATQIASWGASSLGDIPLPGDYDGDGKIDIAVWRVSNQTWYIRSSADNSALAKAQGQAGDSPVNARRQ